MILDLLKTINLWWVFLNVVIRWITTKFQTQRYIITMRSSKSPKCSEMSQDNVKIMRIFFVDINVKINFDRLGSRRYFMCPLTIKTHQCILLCICHNNGISHLYFAVLLSHISVLWYIWFTIFLIDKLMNQTSKYKNLWSFKLGYFFEILQVH